ncbi:hypothetical protein [Streptomyces sp. SBT349]|uniref:hypothetical protein n=1 Tax=Streptomyces sp. SBT349 TaxID=1580539 RepID=UPI00069DAB0A|nr:hypothetical protein [Streptomyces sp. SBT349]
MASTPTEVRDTADLDTARRRRTTPPGAGLRTPVAAEVTVLRPAAADGDGTLRAATTVVIDEREPVFPGHYPGLPIFPGVCVIECVHLSCLAATPPGAGRQALEAVESARFLSPVFPGDRLDIDLVWSGEPPALRSTARVRTARGEAARVRVRFRPLEAS